MYGFPRPGSPPRYPAQKSAISQLSRSVVISAVVMAVVVPWYVGVYHLFKWAF